MAFFLFFAASLFPSHGPTPATENWPQFRGPGGKGQSATTALPLTWGETVNVRWKVPVHDRGWSSPVVWGDQVWLTTARADGKQLFAVALDRGTGRTVNDVKVFDVPKPAFCHPANTYASCSPVIEEGRVYVHFGSAGTACLDTASGEVLWRRQDFPCDHFRGPASSPFLYRDLLYLTFDGFDRQYVVALDKKTGRTAWKKDRSFAYGNLDGDGKKGYGTPAIVEVEGRPLLISPAAVGTTAYDPFTGEEIWKVRHGGMNVSAVPLFGHGLVYVCTGDGGLQLVAIRPGGRGDVTVDHVAWTYNKAVPNHSSPLLIGDHLYLISEGGVVTCLEARSGREVYKQRLPGHFWASPVFAAGRLYFLSEDGVTSVVEEGETWKVLAGNKLDGPFRATPALAGKALFLRSGTHLYCIEDKQQGTR